MQGVGEHSMKRIFNLKICSYNIWHGDGEPVTIMRELAI